MPSLPWLSPAQLTAENVSKLFILIRDLYEQMINTFWFIQNYNHEWMPFCLEISNIQEYLSLITGFYRVGFQINLSNLTGPIAEILRSEICPENSWNCRRLVKSLYLFIFWQSRRTRQFSVQVTTYLSYKDWLLCIIRSIEKIAC